MGQEFVNHLIEITVMWKTVAEPLWRTEDWTLSNVPNCRAVRRGTGLLSAVASSNCSVSATSAAVDASDLFMPAFRNPSTVSMAFGTLRS